MGRKSFEYQNPSEISPRSGQTVGVEVSNDSFSEESIMQGSHESRSLRNTSMDFAKDETDTSHSGQPYEALSFFPAKSDPSEVESLDQGITQKGSVLNNARSARDLSRDAAAWRVVEKISDETLTPHGQHSNTTDDRQSVSSPLILDKLQKAIAQKAIDGSRVELGFPPIPHERPDIVTLFSHPSARVIKFNTSGLRTASSLSSLRMRRTDGSETLPWSYPTESTIAVGAIKIYRVPGSVSFLHSGSLLHAILSRTQCWCVDGVSTFAFRVLPETYYRLELPGVTVKDLELVEGLKATLEMVLVYERTPCPFVRGPSINLAQPVIAEDLDDDDSICAESIFSQDSTASTATSLGGTFGAVDVLDMVKRTTSAVFSGDLAQSINSAAIQDPGIGPERYRRNIRRMIKTFGRDLRAEAGDSAERRVAAAMQTRRISTHVAQEIMTKAEAPRPSSCRAAECSEWMNEEQHSDTSTESADEDEVALTREPEDEAKIRNFVLGSDACMQFKRTLLDFVHKPYEKRVMAALDSSVNRTACYDRDYLARVAREISWVPRDLLCFSQDQSLTMADHFKGYVEDFMGETWNWSPFAARRYPLQPDCCRLSWKSVSLLLFHMVFI